MHGQSHVDDRKACESLEAVGIETESGVGPASQKNARRGGLGQSAMFIDCCGQIVGFRIVIKVEPETGEHQGLECAKETDLAGKSL